MQKYSQNHERSAFLSAIHVRCDQCFQYFRFRSKRNCWCSSRNQFISTVNCTRSYIHLLLSIWTAYNKSTWYRREFLQIKLVFTANWVEIFAHLSNSKYTTRISIEMHWAFWLFVECIWCGKQFFSFFLKLFCLWISFLQAFCGIFYLFLINLTEINSFGFFRLSEVLALIYYFSRALTNKAI